MKRDLSWERMKAAYTIGLFLHRTLLSDESVSRRLACDLGGNLT